MTESPVKNGPPPGSRPEKPRYFGVPVWARWLLGLTLARAALLPAFELFPQEAYYAFYAQAPALSYFDHPPLLAWGLAASLRLFGHHAVAVRAVPFLCSILTQLAFLALARRFVPFSVGRAALLFGTTFAVTVLSLIALPDAPLVLAWSLSLWALARAVFDGRRWAWPLFGLASGLAFDAKYTGAALWVGLLAFLLASPRHRRLLGTAGPWLALGTAQLVALPVFVWNAEHGWASFLFQTAGRAETASGPGLRHLLGLAGSQGALLLPPLLLTLGAVVWRGLRRLAQRGLGPEELFLAAFCLPVLLFGAAASTVVLVKPNWLLPAYVTSVLWVARNTGPRLLRWNLWSSAVLHVLLLLELTLYPVVLRTDDTWLGWRALAAELGRRVQPGEFVFSADDYKTSAELLFYSDLEVYGRNVLGEPALQFDYQRADLAGLLGRGALFVDSAPGDPAGVEPPGPPPARLSSAFREVWAEPPVRILFRGRPVRSFRVWRCVDYRGSPGR